MFVQKFVHRRTILLATGALLLGAAGCGSDATADDVQSDPDQVSGKVTMWIYPIGGDLESSWWEPKVAEFEEQYSEVDVDVVVQPWENRDEKLTTAIAGGEGPDVVYLIPDQVPQYAQIDALAEVSDAMASDEDDFRESALAAMTYEGKLYGVPLLQSATGTLVNKKVLADAGITEIPKTWDDVLAAAPKLKAKGYFTTQYLADPSQTLNQSFYPLLWQAGGQVLSDDGTTAAFNSDAGVRALEFVKELVDGGYVPKELLTTTLKGAPPFAQGKVAMLISTPSALIAQLELDPANFDVGPPLEETTMANYGTVGGLAILDGAEDKVAAKAWVEWVTDTPQLTEYLPPRKYIAPRESVGALYADDPLSGAEESYVDSMKPGVIHPQARQIMDLIKPHIQAALLGKSSPKEALDAAADDVNDLLARG